MIHEANMPVYMGSRFSLRTYGSTRGSTRGPRGPKKPFGSKDDVLETIHPRDKSSKRRLSKQTKSPMKYMTYLNSCMLA